jgi:ATP-dependent Clp protease ATP-binding subunit ClpC
MLYNFQSSASVKKILSHAKDLSKKLGINYIASEHILYGITAVTDTAASKILANFGVTKNSILQVFVASGAKGENIYDDDIELTPTAKEIFTKATVLAVHYGQDYYGAEHILLGLLFNEQSVAVSKILKGTFKIDTKQIVDQLVAALSQESKEETRTQKVAGKEDKQSGSRLPQELLELGIDLTQKAREGKIDKIIGREKETERIIEVHKK